MKPTNYFGGTWESSTSKRESRKDGEDGINENLKNPLKLFLTVELIGTKDLPELKMVIADAQGNPIRTAEYRANIKIEFEKENGKKINVIDSAVFGDVTQPLFAVGKLWKCGWGIDPENDNKAWLKKGKARMPIRFHRNSTVTEMRIYRAAEEELLYGEESEEELKIRKLDVKESLNDELEKEKWNENWFYLANGSPARYDWDKYTAYDPSGLGTKGFKYRTTIIGARLGDEIMWKDMELFECSELWEEREKIEFGEKEEVVITILERRPRDPGDS